MTKGRCRICGEIGSLTRDHVPPKSTVTTDIREARHLTQYLDCEERAVRKVKGSIDFPSICRRCNTDRLGSEYDPELKAFCDQVATWIRARYSHNLTLGPRFKVHCKPQRLLRAIIGHLLAVEPDVKRWLPIKDAPMPNSYRQYFLDPTLPLPEEIRVYCWPYPSQKQVIIRSAGIMEYSKKGVIVSDFLKFFPIGFWVTWEQPDSVSIALTEITPKQSCPLDDICEVEIRLDLVPPIDWPEDPDQLGKLGMLLANDRLTVITE